MLARTRDTFAIVRDADDLGGARTAVAMLECLGADLERLFAGYRRYNTTPAVYALLVVTGVLVYALLWHHREDEVVRLRPDFTDEEIARLSSLFARLRERLDDNQLLSTETVSRSYGELVLVEYSPVAYWRAAAAEGVSGKARAAFVTSRDPYHLTRAGELGLVPAHPLFD
jgi:hypothetical protein